MNKTPLYDCHIQANAVMVDFHGWQMPLHYGSQLDEHHIVRKHCGMFDVSHMTVVDVLGAGGRNFLRHLLANDIDSLTRPGQALYSCLLNQHGGIIDDLIVYFRSPDNYRIISNAATRQKVLAWVREQADGFSVWLQERPELAMLAIQGPKSFDILKEVLSPSLVDALTTLQPFESVDIQEWFVARTGYTGEDGFELVLPEELLRELWPKLLDANVHPCGLGARDTLRLEAGMMLSGQDMDETTTPFESGLSWTVKLEPNERDFIGRGALASQRLQGINKKMVGLVLEDKGVIRPNYKVVLEDSDDSGIVASGGFSPTLARSIALARVPKTIGEHCFVEIRGKACRALVTKTRFVKQGKILVDLPD